MLAKSRRIPHRSIRIYLVVGFAALLFFAYRMFADEPYARSREYDLQHSRIALRFDVDQRKVFGDVTHSLAVLHEGTSKIAFDSVGLTIQSAAVNKSPAKFETTPGKLIVSLPSGAHTGDKFDIQIRYEGKPNKGLYFILPDKNYPDRPTQIWTQGESEDTRYYLPTYDYPNDRLTTETILTVPAAWITVANGKLMGVADATGGMKTWTWRESVPSSTYLITVAAGEFDEIKQSWRNIPVTYYAPKGRGDRLAANYERTPAMMELFTKKLGVDYPWEKYAQVMVDDFVAGGMENSSATTNTSSSLKNPKLVPEYPEDEDPLISHELGHQWFGDLVTCKDWGDVWLNEGFATFLETVWTESHNSKDQAQYDLWKNARDWFGNTDLYAKPIVRFDFNDSSIFDDNSYEKAGWVLYMLRHQIGEDAFWRGLKRYLEANRGKNVVTADLVKAIEEANHIDVDRFFRQWIYGAGAPKFEVSYNYDDGNHQVMLKVKQTQKAEGYVSIFQIPVEVEVTTTSGPRLYSIMVSKDAETFTLPVSSAPLMVLFDKGGYILKQVEFHKEKKEWLYQLKNATEFPDRADAVAALSRIKDDDVTAALGTALNNDKASGIRELSADALGHIGSPSALKELLNGLNSNPQAWVRQRIVAALGHFKDEPKLVTKLESIATEDHSYRARASALEALGSLKPPQAYSILTTAVSGESPDGFLRDAALRSLGYLGNDKATPLVRDWSLPGKPVESRQAAIAALGRLDKGNKEITQQIESYLTEPHAPVQFAAIRALGNRGDASAIPALEALLKNQELSIEIVPMIKEQIDRLQQPAGSKKKPQKGEEAEGDEDQNAPSDSTGIVQRLDQLEQLVQEINARLKSIEARLAAARQ
jgi:aminopeptidase N